MTEHGQDHPGRSREQAPRGVGRAGEKVEAVKPQLLSGAVAGLVLVVIVAYLLGRRRGRKRSAIVEIRRV